MGYTPPDQLRLGPLCATSGNSGPRARQNPEARPSQALAGALTIPLHCGVGTHSLTCTLVELGTASGLVLPHPKPGPRFTIFLGPGLGGSSLCVLRVWEWACARVVFVY